MKYLVILLLAVSSNDLFSQVSIKAKQDSSIYNESLTVYKADPILWALLKNIVLSDTVKYYNPKNFYFNIHFTSDTNGVFVTISPDRWNKSGVVSSFGIIDFRGMKFLMQIGKGELKTINFLTATKKKIEVTRISPNPYFYDKFDTEVELLTSKPSLSGQLKLSNGNKIYITILTKYQLNGYTQ